MVFRYFECGNDSINCTGDNLSLPGVVPNEPVNELSIERVGNEQVIHVKIQKLILYGTVESFEVRVHLRGLRVDVVVRHMKTAQFSVKVFLEFAPVVG